MAAEDRPGGVDLILVRRELALARRRALGAWPRPTARLRRGRDVASLEVPPWRTLRLCDRNSVHAYRRSDRAAGVRSFPRPLGDRRSGDPDRVVRWIAQRC